MLAVIFVVSYTVSINADDRTEGKGFRCVGTITSPWTKTCGDHAKHLCTKKDGERTAQSTKDCERGNYGTDYCKTTTSFAVNGSKKCKLEGNKCVNPDIKTTKEVKDCKSKP